MSARFVAAAKKETQPTEVVRQCSTEMCADAAPRLADSRMNKRRPQKFFRESTVGLRKNFLARAARVRQLPMIPLSPWGSSHSGSVSRTGVGTQTQGF